jgi:5-carboxymethyl-2-hydroxymuconate isomerase
MAAVGYDQATIDHVNTYLDAILKIVAGRQDELPDHVKNDLAALGDAELSGAEQLAAIVDQQRKG